MDDLWVDAPLRQEIGAIEACVTIAALGIEDPQLGPPVRRAEPVARDHRLGPLADDVASEADPRPARELEPKAGHLLHGAPDGPRHAGRLEDDQQRSRPPRESGQPPETIGHGGSTSATACPATLVRIGAFRWLQSRHLRAWRCPDERQIDEEEVDRPALDDGAGHRKPFVE